jgi:hypothetical protein
MTMGQLPHAPAHLDAPHPRQQDVQQHDVGWSLGEAAQGLGPVRGHLDLEALTAEARGQRLAIGLLVLHHEDPDALAFGDHVSATPPHGE